MYASPIDGSLYSDLLVEFHVFFLVVGFTHVQTPQFARSNVFTNHPSQQQLQEQDKYKSYLKQQVRLHTVLFGASSVDSVTQKSLVSSL